MIYYINENNILVKNPKDILKYIKNNMIKIKSNYLANHDSYKNEIIKLEKILTKINKDIEDAKGEIK